ncbi:PEGA domain-containing protein, partial [Pyxidicoccus sp. 3LG]
VAAAGLGLLVAGAAVIFLRGPAEATPVKPPETVVAVPHQPGQPQTPTNPTTPEPVRRVELPVITEPPGATVSVNGEARGETPLRLQLQPGDAPVSVTLALNGYEPVTRQVSATDDELRLELRRQGVKPVSGKKPTGQPGGNLGIKTGR